MIVTSFVELINFEYPVTVVEARVVEPYTPASIKKLSVEEP